jgi:hypothetical protein
MSASEESPLGKNRQGSFSKAGTRRASSKSPQLVEAPTSPAGSPNAGLGGKKWKQYAWTFSSTSREPISKALPPASTKYQPNIDFVRSHSPAVTIGTRPLQKAKATTPAPGQYEIPNPNYNGKIFISKTEKVSSIRPDPNVAEREIRPPAVFCQAKGGKISTLPRFKEESTTADTVGPGTYTVSTLPVRRSVGPSFGKPPQGKAALHPLGLSKSQRSVPGPGTYDLTDRTIGFTAHNDISFQGAVYLSRHIYVDGDTDVHVGMSPKQRAALNADMQFLRSTNQDIQRWKMLSALR